MNINTYNKVMNLKIQMDADSTAQMDLRMNFIHSAASLLFNEIITWGGEDFRVEDKIISAEESLISLHADFIVDMPFDEFKQHVGLLYKAFVLCKQPTSVSTLIFGKCRNYVEPEPDPEPAEGEKKKKPNLEKIAINIARGSHHALKDAGFFNRFPFVNTVSTNEKSLHMCIIGNVHRQLKSWIEVDAMSADEYGVAENRLCNAISKCDINEYNALVDFIIFFSDNNILRRFDGKCESFIKKAVLPAIANGTKETPTVYINPEGGKKFRYSLPDGFYEYMLEHPLLCSILMDKYSMLEKISAFARQKSYANYPIMNSSDTHRTQFLLGSNYFKYSLVASGEPVGDLEGADSTRKISQYTGGVSVDDLYIDVGNDMKARILMHKKYHNGAIREDTYFKDLTIHNTPTKSSYLLTYERHGVTMSAFVKEPSIVRSHDEYFVRLNLSGVLEETENDIDRDALMWVCNSSFAKSETAKNKERLAIIMGKTFTLVGVDLGLRNPYTVSAGTVTVSGPVNKINITDSVICPNDSVIGDQYYDLSCDLNRMITFNWHTKSLYKAGKKDECTKDMQVLIANAQEYLKHVHVGDRKRELFDAFSAKDPVHVMNELKEQTRSMPLLELKKSHEWTGGLLFKYLNYLYNSIKKERSDSRKTEERTAKTFTWLDCIKSMMRVKTSLCTMGEDEYIKNDSSAAFQYYNQVKAKYLQHIAAGIGRYALEKGAQGVILESLNSFSMNKKNSAKENRLLAHWSAKSIQDAVINFCSPYGIFVETVNESCTSRVHHETGLFGYRKDESLFTRIDGAIVEVNADINASKNVVGRFVSRHTDLAKFSIPNGEAVDEEEEDKKCGKRVTGALIYHGTTVAGLRKGFPGDDCAYRHGDAWISKREKKAIEDGIKEVVS